MPSRTQVIKYGSERHKRILSALKDRLEKSERKIHCLHDRWKRDEEMFQGYLDLKERDRVRKAAKDTGVVDYVTIRIPFSYAQAMTAHTFWTTVFLSRNPVLQYEPSHGNAELDHLAVETVMDYQIRMGQNLTPLYFWLFDPAKYGIGILHEDWVEDYIQAARIEEQQDLFLGAIPTGRTKKVKITERIRRYHGNRLMNIRPHDWRPDPRVSFHRFQEGEFCGHMFDLSWNDIIEREDLGLYMNVDYIRKHGLPSDDGEYEYGATSPERPEDEVRTELPKRKNRGIQDVTTVRTCYMEVKLIPADWDLGKSTRPEKWEFVFDEPGTFLLRAAPKAEYHGEFSYSVQMHEPEAYTYNTRSLFEIAEPMNDVLDWLFNSHMYAVRRTQNNKGIIDPSRIHMSDVLDPREGILWRAKPSAYGTDLRQAYVQVPTVDVTQNHMADAERVSQLLQLVMGINQSVMGSAGQRGTRTTATEARQNAAFSSNRLKTASEFFSAMGWQPMAQRLLQNTQQYYDEPMWFKVAGQTAATGNQMREITPEDIAGFYSFVPVDGTLPVDRFAMANLWRQIMVDMRNLPQVLQQYDMAKIFEYTAQLAGAKNIRQFRIQVTPDDMAADMLAGIGGIPLGGQMNDAGLGGAGIQETAEGVENQLGGVGEPGQVSGLGQTT